MKNFKATGQLNYSSITHRSFLFIGWNPDVPDWNSLRNGLDAKR